MYVKIYCTEIYGAKVCFLEVFDDENYPYYLMAQKLYGNKFVRFASKLFG